MWAFQKCVVEVGGRPAGASTRGGGCRAITGGYVMTTSPDLVCMRLGNTKHCSHVRPIQTAAA